MITVPVDAAMRRRRDAAVDSGVLAAVDIGASTLRCAVARIETPAETVQGAADLYSGIRIAGYAERPAPSAAAIPEALADVVREACAGMGVPVRPVMVAIGGCHACVVTGEGRIRLDGAARRSDPERAVRRARIAVAQTRVRLSAAVIDYRVDDDVVLDPVDEEGATLTARIGATLASRAPVQSVLRTLDAAGLAPAGLIAAAQCAGAVCLLDSEAQLGAACIDMGARRTGLAVFHGDAPVYLDDIDLGADRLTADLSAAFGVPHDEAERLKRGLDGPPDPDGPPRSAMLGVLRPRLEEILDLARHRLEEAGFYDDGPRPVVLTGGGAAGYGVLETARRLLGPRARLGPPVRIVRPGAEATMGDAAVLGALAEAVRARHDPLERAVLSIAVPATPVRGAIDWLRQNW